MVLNGFSTIAGDGGSGNIEGECHGGVLTITLHNSKAVTDLKLLQVSVERDI